MPRDRASPARKKSSLSGTKVARWNGSLGLKGQRREAILRSVANVLRNSPLSSVTMEEIAAELGMTKGNLYYYFKDKQDILYQCHMRSMETSLRALEHAMAIGRTPSESLRILLLGHINGILDDGFGGILQTDLEHFRSEHRRQYIRKRDELERGVRSLIEEGIRLLEFECANVKLTGFAILGAINWIPKWYRPSGPFSSTEIAEGMVDYFLRGLLPRDAAADKSAARRRAGKRQTTKLSKVVETMEG